MAAVSPGGGGGGEVGIIVKDGGNGGESALQTASQRSTLNGMPRPGGPEGCLKDTWIMTIERELAAPTPPGQSERSKPNISPIVFESIND